MKKRLHRLCHNCILALWDSLIISMIAISHLLALSPLLEVTPKYLDLIQNCFLSRRYESIANVGESRVWWRADFQSGSRVLKKVFWTFSYLYLWHTMWFHTKKLLKTLKFWKSLNSLCKFGSRPQKLPKKRTRSIAIYSNFWICTVHKT